MGFTTSCWLEERWSRRAGDTLIGYGRCWNRSIGNGDVNWRIRPAQRRTGMKRFSRFALVWLVVGFALAPVRAQEAPKDAPKKAPGPAISMSEGVLDSWNEIGHKLIAMAQDFPEDKFSYKPQAESRTFVANMVHASASMYFFTDTAAGKKPRPLSYADDPKDVGVKTRGDP